MKEGRKAHVVNKEGNQIKNGQAQSNWLRTRILTDEVGLLKGTPGRYYCISKFNSRSRSNLNVKTDYVGRRLVQSLQKARISRRGRSRLEEEEEEEEEAALAGRFTVASASRRLFRGATMPQTRLRMRPWLELQINSNKIPGLIWINKEERLFQIPWKHAAKHGWELEKDASLFKSWAIHTGRYKEGDVQPDPKTWKANFRCAMNSLPDIEEVKDKSVSKGCGAVRVYRMLEPSIKSQRKEKSKSSRNKSVRKAVEDIKAEEIAEATSSIQLPEDHSSYVLASYPPEEMEGGSTLDLSTCGLNNVDWRSHSMDMQLPDSTNDLYPFQVSPITSSSDAADEDEDNLNQQFISPTPNNSDWYPTSFGEKGYLTNEPGMQSFSVDLILQDPDGILSSDVMQIDSKNCFDFLLDNLRQPSVASIPCGM
ncbi:hypothetical protein JRQ81_002666 [Phrynocephalus forsythii]|uniref:IRF tryptophan pentad repeat domain-containing protein n=1 Tax=Phrynocephalus forsythii TaxID=171643 RepID=A0A9Q0XIA6_9SAUR|nr:hypothetical protein JRQ81_002666 [Phrynocephalus forsythii]